MYIAAVLSGDLKLQEVFKTGGDFHGAIAEQVFDLIVPEDMGTIEDEETGEMIPCPDKWAYIKYNYKKERQAAKAVSFGIMYGSGPKTVAEAAGITEQRAKDIIADYFDTFKGLDKWLKAQQNLIRNNGFVYSAFGRKRRLPDAKSQNRQVAGHEVRSGVNFLVQSVASDVNLLAGIDMQDWINNNKFDAKIFALVHDSILAEVREDLVPEYCAQLLKYVTKDRGCSIKGQPVGTDFEIGDNYAFI